MSDRFGAKIEYIADYTFGDATNFIKTSVMAGDDAFQLVRESSRVDGYDRYRRALHEYVRLAVYQL